jgi:hypothetical protein
MDMEHGYIAWKCSMFMQHGHTVGHAAWKSSMYIQYGDTGMDHGHEALHTALACRMALHNGQALMTRNVDVVRVCSRDMLHGQSAWYAAWRSSINMQHVLAAWTYIMGMQNEHTARKCSMDI